MLHGVSIIIPTLDSQRTINNCLESIAKQDYAKRNMEVLILDGGSTDDTMEIANKYKHLNLKFIDSGFKDNMEARRQIGFKKAKFDLIAIVDSDNYLGGVDWISRMEEPLRRYGDLIGSFTLHYQYDPDQTLFNRYVALFGGHDPVAYYLKKTDRLKWTQKYWSRKNQVIKATKRYFIVEFNKNDFPTLGCNGFLIRKDNINYKDLKPEEFFHTDILFDLLGDMKGRYAVVDVPLTHDTGATITNSIKKRIEYMSLHSVNLAHLRRYKVFNEKSHKDWINLTKYVLYTVTFIQPIFESVSGYMRLRDRAWFLHPVVCWYFLFGYIYAVSISKIRLIQKRCVNFLQKLRA